MGSVKRYAYTSLVSIIAITFPAMGHASGSAGTYERKDGESGGGTITVEDSSGSVRLVVQIGGIPNGAATPADCGFIAEGKIAAGIFLGTVTRQNVLADLSPQGDAASPGLPALGAVLKRGSIRLTDAIAAPYCGGDGYTLDGDFVRKH
ncbi:MAG: hypothetical protein BGP09_28965 [Rhizobium sp. 60-20]|nr:MAG: hypothetical protein BGP09_28965 [Rhizobium sp. 60-20]RKD35620.1 hypothetical protein BJ928_1379 [Rhizobium sp. WW_1]